MAVDAHRAAHPDPPNDTREISFAHEGAGTCSQHLPPETPPSSTDLRMAEVVRRRLAPIADGWTRGSATERETVEAIIHELSRFAYSLDDRREGSLDPVVEFLTKTQAGHCELFASALALLARTRGIPTRLVVGYRVDELNPFTGRSVVRDRNAHTWVEAWIDGRWQSFDPTPLAEMHASTRPSGWENLTEAISYGWDVTVRFIVDLGLLGVGTIFAVAAVVLLVIRRIQRRRVKAAPEMTATSRPLPAFETLTTALAHVGWERPASEPLERFARRVDRSGEPWSSDVADALTRYAELRYGGLGEARSVARRLDEVARKVATTS
jgi:transglutaminase-like putative cysteine protease